MNMFATKWPAALLLPLSLPYLLITWLRNILYDAGVLRQWKLPCQVIAVGNLTVGGTGKTPMVELIARTFRDRGKRVCVISRGYKRRRRGLVVVSDGQRTLAGLEDSGDEPLMLANKLQGVPVIVDRDRVRAGRLAIERFGAQLLVLDDAFQHRRLRPDVSVVLVDGQRGFGNGWLLPAGPLREPASRLAAATVVMLTRVEGPHAIVPLAARLRQYTPAPVLTARHVPLDLLSADGKRSDSSAWQGRNVAAFCGIAQPDAFFAMLERSGMRLVLRKAFADHHSYTAQEVESLCRQAAQQGAECLITTEKDMVRLEGLAFPLPLWCLRITLQVEELPELMRIIEAHSRGERQRICCEKKT
ncbi:MAG: tetraacyldisaccharide 4'-kinase [bacterium]|jgi:tetraacyldisaccharide 4'-kinase|nr:tetraacyldisaccharide 4'-kinase [candidate division KSB1 bacterium]MDH7560702.1 tetraacyldisaccharide 4'-kinase [bacterium]